MNRQREEQLIRAFSHEIKEAFFHRIPSSDWRLEQASDHYWLFGVRGERIEEHPYLYSIHFDWKNHLLTIRLEQEVLKSTYLFPHVYYRLLHFLEANHIDLLVRNDNHSLKQHLYKKRRIPIDASGKGSREVVKLLEAVRHALQEGIFYFWKEQNTITFSTPLMENRYYKLCIYLDENSPEASMIEIDGMLLKDEATIQDYFQDIQTELMKLQEKEREIMDYVATLHATSYYDPLTKSLMIFQKNIPFSLKLLYPEKNETDFAYAIRFGAEKKQGSNLPELIEAIKEELLLHVKKDRLRAVTEGRV